MMISASILDSVCNPFFQSTQLTVECELYCTVVLFGEVHGRLELLDFKLDSAARSSFIGKYRCKAWIQLVPYHSQQCCNLAWPCCWGCCVYQAFRGSGQYILCIVGNVEQKARHNLVQAALIALPELIRSGSGGELSPVLCNV